MATISTEETVIQEIIDAIKDIGVIELKYRDDPSIRVHDYLLEFEDPTAYAQYLMANVSDDVEKVLRAWSVDAEANEVRETHNRSTRTYQIIVEGYYGVGVKGSGRRLIRTHARKVREAIAGLDINLGGRVHNITATSVPETVREESNIGGNQGFMLRTRWTIEAQKPQADF